MKSYSLIGTRISKPQIVFLSRINDMFHWAIEIIIWNTRHDYQVITLAYDYQ